ncbi:hypothetical protein C8A00DRAFT_33284 [Chaetomidium leptoderma]|uniref:Uncharacterized protein n=1 Tax=Chaetomidium leptoderma TaxID=669021 RepID=A0AAN6ZYV2_9PEZI|nr:hypothetical protein C8A00DRAFT_33284 [Chaetomidium leptoderma]
MCLLEITHYKCGHTCPNEVRKCRNYVEKKSISVSSLRKLFSRNRKDCGDLMRVNQDIATVCSAACAKKLTSKRRSQEKELVRREKERQQRAEASSREYKKNKKEEEAALRRQREERERRDRMERKGHQGIQTQPIMPLASSTSGSVLRSNGRRLRQDETGTLDDPRVRIQAAQQYPQVRPRAQLPAAETVVATKPVMTPAEVRAASSAARELQAKRAARRQEQQQQPRDPRPPRPPQQQPQQQQQQQLRAKDISSARRTRGVVVPTPSKPAPRPKPAPLLPKLEKKKSGGGGWLKRLVGSPSTDSLEWVSQDAARIERG